MKVASRFVLVIHGGQCVDINGETMMQRSSADN